MLRSRVSAPLPWGLEQVTDLGEEVALKGEGFYIKVYRWGTFEVSAESREAVKAGLRSMCLHSRDLRYLVRAAREIAEQVKLLIRAFFNEEVELEQEFEREFSFDGCSGKFRYGPQHGDVDIVCSWGKYGLVVIGEKFNDDVPVTVVFGVRGKEFKGGVPVIVSPFVYVSRKFVSITSCGNNKLCGVYSELRRRVEEGEVVENIKRIFSGIIREELGEEGLRRAEEESYQEEDTEEEGIEEGIE